MFCTPPSLRVSTKEEANGTETVSRVVVDVNAIFVCGDHATVLFLQGSPVSYLRRSNSDAAFILKDFVLYVLCVSAVLHSVCYDFLYAPCWAIADK